MSNPTPSLEPDDVDDDDYCYRCDGSGGYHDCGEDTCCCESSGDGYFEEDWVECPDCGGHGHV